MSKEQFSIKQFLQSPLVVTFFLFLFALFLFGKNLLAKKELWAVHFIDVGQGDAILIQDGRFNVLIDTGKNEEKLNGFLDGNLGLFENKIDLLIVSHIDDDHSLLVPNLVARYNISVVCFPRGFLSDSSKASSNLKALLKKKGVRICELKRGDMIKLNKASLFVLSPEDAFYSDGNTASLVIKAEIFGKSFLLMGDAPKSVEKSLCLADRDFLKSFVLKLGHHGSRSSSDLCLLKFANPKYAVISASKNNRYGHPHKEVLGLLEKLKIKPLFSFRGSISFVYIPGEGFVLKR